MNQEQDGTGVVVVVVDDRESAFFARCQAAAPQRTNLRLAKQQLDLGDIVLRRSRRRQSQSSEEEEDEVLCVIERKTLTDLMSSIRDGRYDEQSFRLRRAAEVHPHNVVYLLEGVASAQLPRLEDRRKLLSATASLLFFKGFSVLRTSSLQDSVDTVLALADKLQRELDKDRGGRTMAYSNCGRGEGGGDGGDGGGVVGDGGGAYVDVVKRCKKDNLTPANFGEVVLAQIPGVSAAAARAIMRPFGHLDEFTAELRRSPGYLATVELSTATAAAATTKRQRTRLPGPTADKILLFLLGETAVAAAAAEATRVKEEAKAVAKAARAVLAAAKKTAAKTSKQTSLQLTN